MNLLIAQWRSVQSFLTRLSWLPPLLVRLFVGYFFFTSGMAKAGDLQGCTEKFVGWGIPLPAFSAALSAYTECIGGALLVVGLFTRFSALALFLNMVVATIVAALPDTHSLRDFVGLSEPLYALSFLWLVFSGPGILSL